MFGVWMLLLFKKIARYNRELCNCLLSICGMLSSWLCWGASWTQWLFQCTISKCTGNILLSWLQDGLFSKEWFILISEMICIFLFVCFIYMFYFFFLTRPWTSVMMKKKERQNKRKRSHRVKGGRKSKQIQMQQVSEYYRAVLSSLMLFEK